MTAREAKAYACAIMGREANAMPGSAEWAIINHFTGEEFSDSDLARVGEALAELSAELIDRGRRWGVGGFVESAGNHGARAREGVRRWHSEP